MARPDYHRSPDRSQFLCTFEAPGSGPQRTHEASVRDPRHASLVRVNAYPNASDQASSRRLESGSERVHRTRERGQSPQSKSRAPPLPQNADSSMAGTFASRVSAVTSSSDSSPGHTPTFSRLSSLKSGSTPSIVSSIRACSSLLNSGWFSNGSPSL